MSTVRATITIDEALIEEANELAESLEISRSRLIAEALREYLERRRSLAVLAALDATYGTEPDAEEAAEEEAVTRAGAAALRRSAGSGG